MRSKLFIFLLYITLTNTVNAENIVWVSEWNVDANGVICDQGWIDLLESQGYTVDANTAGDYMSLDPDKIAALKAADLIIVSRNSNSGNYADDEAEITEWNSIKTPMILMTAYLTRSNRWQWINNSGIEQYADENQMNILDISHPIFAGVTTEAPDLTNEQLDPSMNLVDVIDENIDEGQNTFIPSNDVGNGTLLATRSNDGYVWIAEWVDGEYFNDDSTQIPAAKRMLFSAGGGGGQEAGSMNLNEEGEKIFLNAVAYMLIKEYKAYGPKPANGATDVPRDASLSWKSGIYAEKHDLYFGANFNDANEATISDPRGVLVSESQDGTTFEPLGTELLEYGRTYYWRVDEINDIETDSPWKGRTWNFTTVNFLPVEDFEDYDDANNIIYYTWLDYYTNNTGMTVGYLEAPYAEQEIVHIGKQSMPLQYDNDGTINEGTDLEKTGTLFYSEAERQWTEPQDWTRDNVESLTIWFKGNPAQVSSFTEEPAGIYKVKGIGEDIFGAHDEFHFAYKELSGSASIIAKVDSLENTDPFARAGIMIRDTLDAGAKYCALFITPENGVRYQYRTNIDDTTEREFDPNVAAPYWVRFERTSGGLLRSYYSENGTDWTSFSLKTITMNNPIYIGLAVTSHDPLVACEAQFSNVSFPNTTVSDEWASVDIGLTTNDTETMYVILNNSAVIYHDDPNAATIDQWTEWNIPLQNFADRGVNLTNITSLGIGIGNRDNTQPGGKGIMYIDDIRLYRPPISNGN